MTYALPAAPDLAGLPRVEVSVADNFRELECVSVLAVAALMVAAVSAIGATGVAVVILHLSVDAAIIVVACCPV
jgi:hypothetical protein